MSKLINNSNSTSTSTHFIDWVTRLANRYGNKKLDSLRRLEIELVNDLRDGKITLGEAEDIYLRRVGLTKFDITSINL